MEVKNTGAVPKDLLLCIIILYGLKYRILLFLSIKKMTKVTFLPNSKQSKIPLDSIHYTWKPKSGDMNYKNIRVKFSSLVALLFFGLMIILTGCDQEGRGFALPEGNVENGKLLFSTLRCNECHTTSEIKWLGNTENLKVPLGGDVTRLKSYGDLVTSIINPSHKIANGYEVKGTNADGTSKMMIYNEIITVQELIDIVTYLQTEYHIVTPPNNLYPPYY